MNMLKTMTDMIAGRQIETALRIRDDPFGLAAMSLVP
jgi:hypothetical protein